MIAIIITLIICSTVLYCTKSIVSLVDRCVDKYTVSPDMAEPMVITDSELEQAYTDLAKTGDTTTDLGEFMKMMTEDFDENY